MIRTLVLTREEKTGAENTEDLLQETIFRLLQIANEEGIKGNKIESFTIDYSRQIGKDEVFKLYFKE